MRCEARWEAHRLGRVDGETFKVTDGRLSLDTSSVSYVVPSGLWQHLCSSMSRTQWVLSRGARMVANATPRISGCLTYVLEGVLVLY